MYANIFKDTLGFEEKRRNFVFKLPVVGDKLQFKSCDLHIPTVFDGKNVQHDMLHDLKKIVQTLASPP